jgi:pyridinium-3,5-bisthiocarboxylic acid mononucleotide nickel chelatase
MKILYIDPIFGISGDMMISALISAGMPFEEIDVLLKKVPLPLPAITPVTLTQEVIKGIHLNIDDSDLHLSIAEMEDTIAGLDIEEKIKQDALGMLNIILDAESKIHAIGREELHLHELSNVDTIIDLLCVAKGMDYFKIDKVYSGPVPCGRGTIKTAHGIIPNPPPVTLEILSGHRIVFYDEPLELTTPTGATIVRHYVKERITSPPFVVEKTGYGVGTYKTTRPDALRIFIGTSEGVPSDEEVWVVECDLDDMEMEYVGAVADRIRGNGALDVLHFPVFMKKGRPGMRLCVTVAQDELERVIELIFRETTTFGMRLKKEGRRVLKREEKSVETSCGPVRVKNGYDAAGSLLKTHIEFEDVKRIAEEKDLSYRTLLETIKIELTTKK